MAWTAFWTYFLGAGWVFARFQPGHAIWPLSMGGLWWLSTRFPHWLRRMAARVPGPLWLRFLCVGLVSTDLVMENLAIAFHGDLHPNLAVNSFLWLGAYGGALLGWWGVTRLFAFSPTQVFIAYAIKGVAVEQNFLIL